MSESKTILIIDEEPATRDVISRMFVESGCETAIAPGGAAGLAAAKQGDFDLVILDMSLPEMSGLDVLNGIKEHKPDLPVVMVIACGSARIAIEAMRLGVCDFVTEPFEPNDLQMLAERAFQSAAKPHTPYPVNASLRDMEKIHIERVLESHDWKQSAVAKILGIDRKTLRNKIREFKLDKHVVAGNS